MAELGLRCCTWALSSCGEQGATPRRGAWAPHHSGLSCRRAQAPGTYTSAVAAHRLSSCGSRTPERRLSNSDARAQSLRGMQDPPGLGLEPVSPALAGGLPTTAPAGKSLINLFIHPLIYSSSCLYILAYKTDLHRVDLNKNMQHYRLMLPQRNETQI